MIHRFGLSSLYDITRDHIRCKTTDSDFFFSGMSTVSEEDIRGWEDVDIVWVEEAHRMSASSWEILYPTIRKETPEFKSEIWFSFNPKNRYDTVYKTFISEGRPNAWVRKVNYYDNPWFPSVLDAERLYDKQNDPERYAHIWLGEPDDASDKRKVLPYALVQMCCSVDAWARMGVPDGMIDVGLDVADTGADKNAMVGRRGPALFSVDYWSAPRLGVTASRADKFCRSEGAARLYYDAGGIGAGIRFPPGRAVSSRPGAVCAASGDVRRGRRGSGRLVYAGL